MWFSWKLLHLIYPFDLTRLHWKTILYNHNLVFGFTLTFCVILLTFPFFHLSSYLNCVVILLVSVRYITFFIFHFLSSYRYLFPFQYPLWFIWYFLICFKGRQTCKCFQMSYWFCCVEIDQWYLNSLKFCYEVVFFSIYCYWWECLSWALMKFLFFYELEWRIQW